MADVLKIRESGSQPWHTVVGIKGDKGDTGDTGARGADFAVLGYFSTLEELQEEITDPSAGDAYGVGTAAPYNIYIFDGVHETWVNNGPVQGVRGEKGETGDRGITGPAGVPGAPGYSPSAKVEATSNGAKITIHDVSGTTETEIYHGRMGVDGRQGPYFTPAVSPQGDISWTNNGGLQNPSPMNITGPQGYSPQKGTDYWTDEDKSDIVQQAAAAISPSTIGAIADPEDKADGKFLRYNAEDHSWHASEVDSAVTAVNGLTGDVYTRLVFNDVAIDRDEWQQMIVPTYEDFPYYVSVALEGVTAQMIPWVVLDVPQIAEGIYCPVVEAYSGGIYIYASEVPSSDFVIPTIVLWR